jgi:hypothetical protein
MIFGIDRLDLIAARPVMTVFRCKTLFGTSKGILKIDIELCAKSMSRDDR